MTREIYQQGAPGMKYGIWDRRQGKFILGVCEDTPMLAVARMCQKLGTEARKYKLEPRALPPEQFE